MLATFNISWLSCPCRLPKVVATYANVPGWDAASCGLWGTAVILLSLVVPEAIVFRAEASERRRFLQELSAAELRAAPAAPCASKALAWASHGVAAAACSLDAHA